jgi:Uma2 family endonuclease
MSTMLKIEEKIEIHYPDSDGAPMSDNTEQFDWIVEVKSNLELLFADNPEVFIAGDLLWYPVEGNNKIRIGPDAMVAFGRPKGRRGSYMQWKEGGIAPQVVFEILSPGNRHTEMVNKWRFYDRYGVEEYYLIDPDKIELSGWRRVDGFLEPIDEMNGWVSPRLQIRFQIELGEIHLYKPDGSPFESYLEIANNRQQERQRTEQEHQRAERLAEKLKTLGIDPDSI